MFSVQEKQRIVLSVLRGECTVRRGGSAQQVLGDVDYEVARPVRPGRFERLGGRCCAWSVFA